MKRKFAIVIATSAALVSCGGETTDTEGSASAEVEQTAEATVNKGIGPVENLEMAAIDDAMASKGEVTFNTKCTACHTMDSKVIGPPLAGVTERRSPEWIMNLVLNPTEMLAKDDDAKALLEEYNNVPMAPLGLTEDEAREVLEYLRTTS